MTDASRIFLKLLQAALCDDAALDALRRDGTDWQSVDWDAVLDAVSQSGMEALSLDGLVRLDPAFSVLNSEANENFRYEWLGMQYNVECEYETYRSKLAKLIAGLNRKGAGRVMVMKGYGLANNYPVPGHRTFGDIDIYSLDGNSELIDRLLSVSEDEDELKEMKMRHSHASFRGCSVENHYHFTNSFAGREYDETAERALIREATVNAVRMDIGGNEFYIPSPTFNAIFLMWHMAQHFIWENVTLRQLCDWMMLLKGHSSEIDWELVTKIWEQDRKTRFAAIVNGALIEYLGMDPSLVPPFERNRGDEERFIEFVLDDKPLKIRGVEAVLKYWRRRWNLRVSQDENWLKHLWKAVISKF